MTTENLTKITLEKNMSANYVEESIFNNEYKNMKLRGPDRRKKDERRLDPREQTPKKTVFLWLKSLFKPRAEVDRRKGERRHTIAGSSQSQHASELTAEELKQLLE